MSEENGRLEKRLKNIINILLQRQLKLDVRESDYLTIDELLQRTDLIGKIKNAVKVAVVDQTNRLYTEKMQRVRDHAKNPIKITEEQLRDLFFSNYYRQNGKPFMIDEGNITEFNALMKYFMNDPEFEKLSPAFSLSKGLCLVGNYGCGKTSMMRAFQENPKQHFHTIYVPSIFDEFKIAEQKDKQKVLSRYTDPALIPYTVANHFRHPKTGICFDDPLKEMSAKEYGESWNLFREIVLRRYDQKNAFNGLNHMTMNGTRAQFSERYGGDVEDRTKEMFNFLVFPEQKSRRG